MEVPFHPMMNVEMITHLIHLGSLILKYADSFIDESVGGLMWSLLLSKREYLGNYRELQFHSARGTKEKKALWGKNFNA